MSSIHELNGIPCTNPDCWCKIFPSHIEKYYDIVNKPKHYKLKGLDVEALDIIKASLTIGEYRGYLVGNCLKYLIRHNRKNNIEDLKKMCFYARELDDCT